MLENIKTTKELALFLSISEQELGKLKTEEWYYCFEIPKPGDTAKRLIESPTGVLRDILDIIGNELQLLYYHKKTEAAHGYIRSRKNDPDVRNIVTNASRHKENKYLLNIDLDDFFYQVDTAKVNAIFNDYTLFSCDRPTETLLTYLVTYRERLPMGSPASPPLSNFATIAMDKELTAWAKRNHFVYTRYVDDLSFSSNMKISRTHFNQITDILSSHRFAADPAKIKWYGKDDIKEITGLLLKDKIVAHDDFFKDFEKDLAKYKEVWLMAHQYPDPGVFKWLDRLGMVLNGRLAFLAMVYNKYHPVYRKYVNRVRSIRQSHTKELSCSWKYMGYHVY